MLSKIWELLIEYVKEKRIWGVVRPALILGAAFLGAQLLTLQYLKWQYDFAPPLSLYMHSFYFKRIVLVFVVGLMTIVALQVGPAVPVMTRMRKVHQYFRVFGKLVFYRTLVGIVASISVIGGVLVLSPKSASRITVKFVNEPLQMKPNALAYLVYELNRRQRTWFFEIDFDPINPEAMTSKEQSECRESHEEIFCYAEKWANGRQAIVITEDPMGAAYFCSHRGLVSVISTADRGSYSPLTDYEFVIFNVIVQSTIIHLDRHSALPADAFLNRGTTGGVFQFNQRKDAVKSMILAASLSPLEEELLLNEFGPEYLRSTRELLSMKWLYAKQVTSDLKTFFDVTLSRSMTP